MENHALIPDGITELKKGLYFLRYDKNTKEFQFAHDSNRPRESVQWRDDGAPSYVFHLAEAITIDMSGLRGDSDVILLLRAIIADLTR